VLRLFYDRTHNRLPSKCLRFSAVTANFLPTEHATSGDNSLAGVSVMVVSCVSSCLNAATFVELDRAPSRRGASEMTAAGRRLAAIDRAMVR
jgi:hypothetical protein